MLSSGKLDVPRPEGAVLGVMTLSAVTVAGAARAIGRAPIGTTAAIVSDDEVLTYAELDGAEPRAGPAPARRPASASGTRVGLLMPNGIDWAVDRVGGDARSARCSSR